MDSTNTENSVGMPPQHRVLGDLTNLTPPPNAKTPVNPHLNYMPLAGQRVRSPDRRSRKIEHAPAQTHKRSSSEIADLLRKEKKFQNSVNEKQLVMDYLHQIRPLLTNLDSLKTNLKALREDFGFTITFKYPEKGGKEVSIIPPDDSLDREELLRLLEKLRGQVKDMDEAFKEGVLSNLSEKIREDIDVTTKELIELDQDSDEFEHQPRMRSSIEINTLLPAYPNRFAAQSDTNKASLPSNAGGSFTVRVPNQEKQKRTKLPARPSESPRQPPQTEETLPKQPIPTKVKNEKPIPSLPVNNGETTPQKVIKTEKPQVTRMETEPQEQSISFTPAEADILFTKNRIDFRNFGSSQVTSRSANIQTPKSITNDTIASESGDLYISSRIESQHSSDDSIDLIENFNTKLESEIRAQQYKYGTLNRNHVLNIIHNIFEKHRISHTDNDHVNINIYLLVDGKNYVINRGDLVLCCILHYYDKVKNIHLENSDLDIKQILRQRVPGKEAHRLPAVAELPDEDDKTDDTKHTHFHFFAKNRYKPELQNTVPLSNVVRQASEDSDDLQDIVNTLQDKLKEYYPEIEMDAPTAACNFTEVDHHFMANLKARETHTESELPPPASALVSPFSETPPAMTAHIVMTPFVAPGSEDDTTDDEVESLQHQNTSPPVAHYKSSANPQANSKGNLFKAEPIKYPSGTGPLGTLDDESTAGSDTESEAGSDVSDSLSLEDLLPSDEKNEDNSFSMLFGRQHPENSLLEESKESAPEYDITRPKTLYLNPDPQTDKEEPDDKTAMSASNHLPFKQAKNRPEDAERTIDTPYDNDQSATPDDYHIEEDIHLIKPLSFTDEDFEKRSDASITPEATSAQQEAFQLPNDFKPDEIATPSENVPIEVADGPDQKNTDFWNEQSALNDLDNWKQRRGAETTPIKQRLNATGAVKFSEAVIANNRDLNETAKEKAAHHKFEALLDANIPNLIPLPFDHQAAAVVNEDILKPLANQTEKRQPDDILHEEVAHAKTNGKGSEELMEGKHQ